MSILDITLHEDVTTGPVYDTATAHTFGIDGMQVVNGVHLVDINEADFMQRYQMTLKNRPTVLNAKTGSFTKEKRSVSLACPYVPTVRDVPQGVIFESIRCEIEAHPNDPGRIAKMRVLMANFLLDPANDEFFNRGSLS